MNALIGGLIGVGAFVIGVWVRETIRVLKIQKILNKDRTVIDFIGTLNGWKVDNYSQDGLRILICPAPPYPNYYLYITYNGERPSPIETKKLIFELTNKNSDVRKAHKLNMPYEHYVRMTK